MPVFVFNRIVVERRKSITCTDARMNGRSSCQGGVVVVVDSYAVVVVRTYPHVHVFICVSLACVFVYLFRMLCSAYIWLKFFLTSCAGQRRGVVLENIYSAY